MATLIAAGGQSVQRKGKSAEEGRLARQEVPPDRQGVKGRCCVSAELHRRLVDNMLATAQQVSTWQQRQRVATKICWAGPTC